jgi:heme A synthase
MHNFSYIAQHFMEWSTLGYTTLLGGAVFWSIMFMGIAGYIYLKNQSVVAFAVIILILLAAFGNTLAGVEALMTLLHIFIALIFTGLLLLFISKYRK